jgi:hypothetical protein
MYDLPISLIVILVTDETDGTAGLGVEAKLEWHSGNRMFASGPLRKSMCDKILLGLRLS